MFLENAFNYIIQKQGRVVKLFDIETSTEISIKIARDNYYRTLEAFEESTIEGHGFVIPKKTLDELSFDLKVNTRIIDEDNATKNYYTIFYIAPMEAQGKIIGYRVRTK